MFFPFQKLPILFLFKTSSLFGIPPWKSSPLNKEWGRELYLWMLVLEFSEWLFSLDTGGGQPNTSQYETLGGQQPPMRDEYASAPYDHKAVPPHYQSANSQRFP